MVVNGCRGFLHSFRDFRGFKRFSVVVEGCTFEIITTTTPTIPYYTINPSYCWMPDLENQEWWVKKLFDGMPTLPTHPAFIPV